MKSKYILILHTVLFTTFVIASLTTSLLAFIAPTLIPGRYLVIGAVILAVIVFRVWPLYGGACPFTVWENRFRERELLGSSYRGPCIDHYAEKWFNIHLPSGVSTKLLEILLFLPIVAGIFNW